MSTKLKQRADGQVRSSELVSWRVWHVGKRKWLWDGRMFATQREAARAKITATRGRRDALTNYLRICARVVAVRADGSSPMRDAVQKQWDKTIGKPDNDQAEAAANRDLGKPRTL